MFHLKYSITFSQLQNTLQCCCSCSNTTNNAWAIWHSHCNLLLYYCFHSFNNLSSNYFCPNVLIFLPCISFPFPSGNLSNSSLYWFKATLYSYSSQCNSCDKSPIPKALSGLHCTRPTHLSAQKENKNKTQGRTNTIKKENKQQTLRTSYKPFCWEVFIHCETFM